MRTGSGVYCLYSDYLGSTSLATNAGGATVAEQRYYPYGEVRWISGTLPTDLTFTGQRSEAGIGLMDYRARYYSPRLGRFISPDTLVPDPANPQSLNRYSYVYNNALRYTDPSGYLSEDEIMGYLGASTWDEVLALFGEGEALAGRWGWLEALRQAELGDEIAFYDDAQGTWPPSGSTKLRGELIDQDGQLCIQSGSDLVSANDAAWQGNVYYISRSLGRSGPPVPYTGPLYANQMYMHLRFDFSDIDKTDAALDLVGLATSLVPCPVAQIVGGSADTVSLYRDALTLYNARVNGASEEEWRSAWWGFGLDVGGLDF